MIHGVVPLGCHQSLVVRVTGVGGVARVRPLLSPCDWLHRLQSTAPLSVVSLPPCACGVMWSGSALFGRLPCS